VEERSSESIERGNASIRKLKEWVKLMLHAKNRGVWGSSANLPT
jgi:hypothetical protein